MLRRYCFILSVTLLLFFDAVSLSAGNLVVKNRRASWKSIDVNQIDTSRYAFFDYLSPDSACVYYGSLGRNGAVIIGNKSWVADNPDKDIYARDLADSFRKYFIRDIVVTLICALFWMATIIGVLFSTIRSRRREQLVCLDNQIEPVSIKLRIINFVIDTCIVSALLRLHMIIVIILLAFVVRADVFDSMLLPYLLSFLSVKIWICVCYFFYSEFLSGRTFGKRMTSTTIVNECGEKPTAKAILVRTICRLIPLDFCSCFFYREQLKKGQYIFWHDKFSHTRVVESAS